MLTHRQTDRSTTFPQPLKLALFGLFHFFLIWGGGSMTAFPALCGLSWERANSVSHLSPTLKGSYRLFPRLHTHTHTPSQSGTHALQQLTTAETENELNAQQRFVLPFGAEFGGKEGWHLHLAWGFPSGPSRFRSTPVSMTVDFSACR